MTYDDLRKKTLAELREIAKGLDHEAVQGYSQMHKDRLLPAICAALGIEAHEHHHLAEGFDKAAIKARMRVLKTERDKALEAHDPDRLRALRRELHSLNHRIRAHTV
jgi:hypothetical protein